MAKRYFVEYESDKVVCGSNKHEYCRTNTLKTAIGVAKRVKKELADQNARNVRVYDCFAELDPATNFVPCVFSVE